MDKFEIPLSLAKKAAPDFDAAVAEYIKALEVHRTQAGVPAPTAHPLIERAVARVQHPTQGIYQPEHTYQREIDGVVMTVTEPIGDPVTFMSSAKPDDFVPNYVIIDDTPPPPTLDEHKTALAQAAAKAADAAVDRVSPPLRRRLLRMSAEHALAIEPDRRSPAEHEALAKREETDAEVNAIHFHLARVEAQIHDLTAETIDGWEMPPFPK